MRRRMLGSLGGAKLPYDAEVEYLYATRNNYIKTGIILGSSRTFRWSAIASIGITTSTELPVMSCWTHSIQWANLFFGGSGGAESLSMYAAYDGGHLRPKTPIKRREFYDISCGMDQEGIYGFENKRFIAVGGIPNAVPLAQYPNNPTEIAILARGDLDNANSAFVRSVKIEVGIETLFDGIAVRKDGIGYMYDRVSKQLFGNAGPGMLVVGPDKS